MVKGLPAMQETWGQADPLEKEWNPLQHSCLETPMDGGAWRPTPHGVAELAMTERHTQFELKCLAAGPGASGTKLKEILSLGAIFNFTSWEPQFCITCPIIVQPLPGRHLATDSLRKPGGHIFTCSHHPVPSPPVPLKAWHFGQESF